MSRIGTILRDVIRSLFRRAATGRYPFKRSPAPDRLRGRLTWNPEKCTGCCLCTMDCPSNAIELIVVDKDSKRFVMRYHVDRCTFCAQCVQSCQFKCLGMSKDEWELAALSKEPFTVNYGNEPEVEAVLARVPRQDPETVTPPESSA